MKFVADDGTVFNCMEDCKRYEKYPPMIMYNCFGRTMDASDVKVVNIIQEEGAEYFTDLCDREDLETEGIDGRTGVFFWSDDDGRFYRIDSEVVDIIKEM